MNFSKTGRIIVVMLVGSATLAQAAITLDFSSLPGSTIQFNGSSSSFNINPAGGDQWWVTSVQNGLGDSLSLRGRFTGGPWTYSGITVNGPDQNAAVVSPFGTFTLFDGTGGSATGAISWVNVNTHQYVGGLNASASVNITGMSYTPGSTPISDLQNLVAYGQGSVLLSFQFNPGMTLTDLTTGSGPYRTSYSGSMVPVVPEPATLLLAGVGLLLAVARRGFRRI